MGTDRETLYKQSMQHARDMRAKITRRQMLQISAAMAAAAGVGVAPKWARSSDTNGPGWYTDDSLEGDVVAYTFAGQRWGLPLEAVVGTFKERFPNVNVQDHRGAGGRSLHQDAGLRGLQVGLLQLRHQRPQRDVVDRHHRHAAQPR